MPEPGPNKALRCALEQVQAAGERTPGLLPRVSAITVVVPHAVHEARQLRQQRLHSHRKGQ